MKTSGLLLYFVVNVLLTASFSAHTTTDDPVENSPSSEIGFNRAAQRLHVGDGKAALTSRRQHSLNKAFLRAVTHNDLEAVRYLLPSGAEVNTLLENGGSALHLASSRGFIRIMRVQSELLKRDRSLTHLTNSELVTPLHEAALNAQVTAVQILLDAGANINARDIYGSTPLHCAAFNEDSLLGRFLIARGADPDAKDKFDSTALHIAAYSGHKMMATILASKGHSLNVKDKAGFTPLHTAAYYGHESTINHLLTLGADPSLKDHKGRKPGEIVCLCISKRSGACDDTCVPPSDIDDPDP